MESRIGHRNFFFPALILIASGLLPEPADAAVKTPDCAALETWAGTIDRNDRWTPVDGGRSWLPRAFAGDAFVKLFGAAPLDWTPAEIKATGAHLYACSKAATKAKRYDAQKALLQARGYVTGSLSKVHREAERMAARGGAKPQTAQASPAARSTTRATTGSPAEERRAARERAAAEKRAARERAAAERQAARQQQMASRKKEALDGAVAKLLAEPDSPDLLRALALVRTTDVTDREKYTAALRAVGSNAGNGVLQLLYRDRHPLTDPDLLARIEAREKPLHDKVIADKLAAIKEVGATTRGLQFLSKVWQELPREMGPALTEADRQTIGVAIRDKRIAVFETIVARAKELIDRSPANAEGLHRVDKIVVNTRKAIVVGQYVNEVRKYARVRKAAISDQALEAATGKLDAFPGTVKGLEGIHGFALKEAGTFRPYAKKEVGDHYVAVAVDKINAVARGALPEFKKQLAALPENDDGLHEADVRLKKVQAMTEIDAKIRADYAAAATDRREAITAALDAAFAERRRKALAAGADPDLAGYTFVDKMTGTAVEFRDEKRAFFATLGMRAAATYEVSEDDVIVTGPHGNVVFTKGDKVLTGMGLTLKRQR